MASSQPSCYPCWLAERLSAAGIHKLQQLTEVDPRRLESIAQRHYPFGGFEAFLLTTPCKSGEAKFYTASPV